MNVKKNTTVNKDETTLCAGLQFLGRTGHSSQYISTQIQENVSGEMQHLTKVSQKTPEEDICQGQLQLWTLVKKAELYDLPDDYEKKPVASMKRRGGICETSSLERTGLSLALKQYMQMRHLRNYCLL